jgi:hypothetical protein
MIPLATICTLMSAKLSEPISPSFNRMIDLLSMDEKQYVTKELLKELEAEVLVKLEFDLQLPGPLEPLQRFIGLLGYQKKSEVYSIASQICMFSLVDSCFLNIPPSEIAAAAAILSVNIFNSSRNYSFFEH